jgi:hypothetical protein
VTVLELLPAVDVADGQAVRLVQGEAGSETSYGDPVEAALQWQRDGAEWVHLVDLDAAFGRGSNRELLARVVQTLDVQVEMSGGIRDDASSRRRWRPAAPGSTSARRRSSRPTGAPGPSPRTGTGSRSAWTSGAPRWPPAAGRRTAATCGTCWRGWTARAAPGTS